MPMSSRLRSFLAAAAAVVLIAACASEPPVQPASEASLSPARIAALLASADRSDADRSTDARRKPAEMLAFIGVRPGMTVFDLFTGGGYTSELLARAAGPTGRVFGQSAGARSGPLLAARALRMNTDNLSFVQAPFDSPIPQEMAGKVDIVTLMFNYHDLGSMGVDRARMNAAVFAALKPGGAYVIADHAGRPGTGISESRTLHRIDEAFLRREVEAAGFRFDREGTFLRNPADPRDREDPEPAMAKDEFVFRFVKP